MSITIKDVAKHVGVTPATVSMVINDRPRISDATRKRVLLAIEELDYFPHAGARSLVLQRTKAVGITASLSGGYPILETLAGIEGAALESGYDLVLYGARGLVETEDAVITRIARERKVDGLIALDMLLSPKQLGYFQKNNVAIVSLGGEMEGCDQILVDQSQVAYLATQHLLGLGHKRIALVNGPSEFAPGKRRLEGYRQALVEASLPLDPALSLRAIDNSREAGFEAARQVLQLRPAPTAIFVAAGDACAAGLLRSLQAQGIEVPRQMSVVGCDDLPFADLLQPGLTTVRLPLAMMGAEAFQWLLQSMQTGELPRRRKKLVFEPELVIRQSTGKARES